MRRVLILTGLMFAGLTYYYWLQLKDISPKYSTVVYDRHGDKFDAFLSSDDKWRFEASLDRVGSFYREAALCLEDRRFWYHPGVDAISLGRALFQNISSGRVVSGASTVTMQVARLSRPQRRNLQAKVEEALFAVFLETFYSKRDILKLYFELSPYGYNIEGVEAASHLLLGKPIADASAAEVATLLLIPQKPDRIRKLSAEQWKVLRDRNLERFENCGLISAENKVVEVGRPLVIPKPQWFPQPRHISRQLAKKGNGAFHSSLHLGLQKQVEDLLSKREVFLKSKGIHNAAILIVENDSGEAWSAVGNMKSKHHSQQINALIQSRSTGSTLKPLLYAMGLEQGLILPETWLQDVPVTLGSYKPENYDNSFRGLIDAESALSYSLNVPFVILLRKLGMDHFLGEIESIGIRIIDSKQSLGLSSALGALSLAPMDLAKIYLSFAREGKRSKIYFKRTHPPQSEDVWRNRGAVKLLNRALIKQKRREHIAQRYLLHKKEQIKWKTGTSQGRKDAWAVGYSSKFTTLVWLGNLDMQPSSELVGAQAAGPLLFEIFDILEKRNHLDSSFLSSDEGLEELEICAVSGYRPTVGCPTKRAVGLSKRSFIRKCPFHQRVEVEAMTGQRVFPGCREGMKTRYATDFYLPAKVKAWSRKKEKRSPIHPQCLQQVQVVGTKLLIKEPADGLVYYMSHSQKILRLPLSVHAKDGQKDTRCYLNGDSVDTERLLYLELGKGTYTLFCTDDLARSASSNFRVAHY